MLLFQLVSAERESQPIDSLCRHRILNHESLYLCRLFSVFYFISINGPRNMDHFHLQLKKISETGVIIVAQQTELLSNTGARIPVQIVLLPIQFLAIAPGKTAEDGQVLCPLPHMWKTVVEFQASDFTVIWPRHSCYTHLEREPRL